MAIAQDERVESVEPHRNDEKGRPKLPELEQGTCVNVSFRLRGEAV